MRLGCRWIVPRHKEFHFYSSVLRTAHTHRPHICQCCSHIEILIIAIKRQNSTTFQTSFVTCVWLASLQYGTITIKGWTCILYCMYAWGYSMSHLVVLCGGLYRHTVITLAITVTGPGRTVFGVVPAASFYQEIRPFPLDQPHELRRYTGHWHKSNYDRSEI